MPDRIEAGTLLLATAAAGGDVLLKDWHGNHSAALFAKLQEVGLPIIKTTAGIRLKATKCPQATDLCTLPYPGFPTDLQAPFMALLSFASGTSIIRETIFEDRFHQVPWLKRLGADIRLYGECALIYGRKQLFGARLEATDLRAGAALTIAALAAEGVSQIEQVQHIDRGYQQWELTLRALGAEIKREKVLPNELLITPPKHLRLVQAWG
jgi:UDP-N-acetylglucosamine 1-carboxyvinyltransferase